MGRSSKKSFAAQHYDKLILAATAIFMVVSLVLSMNMASSTDSDINAELNKVKREKNKEHDKIKDFDSSAFDKAMVNFSTSYKMSEDALFLVAPERVTCVECARPIRLDADDCPYCAAKQPSDEVGEDWDSDGDGMPDAWEKQFGLNPILADDADLDLDNDGFTNIEEFLSNTDPSNPASHPPRYKFLRVSTVNVMRFPYLCKSKALNPDKSYKFAFKGPTGQDFWLRKGDELDKTGFILKEYSFTNVVVASSVGKVKKELFNVVLEKGEDTVEFIEGKEPQSSVFEATFVCTKDAAETPYTVKRQESFAFDGETFTLLSIDRKNRTAVLKRKSSGEQLVVPSK